MPATIHWKMSLSHLVEGNLRFRLGLRSVEAFASALKLKEFAEHGQRPSAVILTCSDSRVPTEILFDKGVGDLFVIRVAGNIISDSVIASIEYAALALGTPLCVVMGHTQCGAVKAAVDSVVKKSASPTPYIHSLLQDISPAVEKVLGMNASYDSEEIFLKQAILQNIENQKMLIQERSASIRGLIQTGSFQIVGALYNLHDGHVHFDKAMLADIPASRFSTTSTFEFIEGV